MIFSKLFLDLSRCSNKSKAMVKGHFQPSWTHVSVCKLKKSLEIAHLGIDSAAQEGVRAMRVEG